jgi:NAD(P)-dependent dehydrogenase (short-subunit alcohol dehydrogenase family)
MNPTAPDQSASPVVLVVGGSQGIGRGIALAHARRGACVVAVARTAEALEMLEKESAAQGLAITTLIGDITEPGSPQRVVDAAVDRHGRLDAVVYAPATTRRKPSLDVPGSDFAEGLHLNLTSAFLTAQAAARHMVRTAGGSILFIGSLNGAQGIAATAMYSAAKGALVSMSRSLAVEWAPHAIRVNVVVPGFIETENPGKAFRDPGLRSWMLDRIPLGTFGSPEDVATAAAFLGSPDARYVTGQVLVVDGGVAA